MDDSQVLGLVRAWKAAPDAEAVELLKVAIADALADGAGAGERRDTLEVALESCNPDEPGAIAALRGAVAALAAVSAVSGADAMDQIPPQPVITLDPGPEGDDPFTIGAAFGRVPAVCSFGEPMLLSGPGGAGKSYLALALMVAAAGGSGRALGFAVRRGRVAYLSYEDSAQRVGHRLKAIGASRKAAGQLAIMDAPPLFQPDPDGGYGAVTVAPAWTELRERCADASLALLVVDPVAAVIGAANLNDASAARSVMRAFARLSDDTDTGVVCLSHDTKAARNEARAGGEPGAGAVGGSGQWHDAARAVMYLYRAAGSDNREVACIKCNHGRDGWAVPLAADVDADGRYHGFRYGGSVIEDYEAVRADRAERARKRAKARKPADGGSDGEFTIA